jgi:hypothetical protein
MGRDNEFIAIRLDTWPEWGSSQSNPINQDPDSKGQ